MIPIQVSHKVHAYKKEYLINEKNSMFSLEWRATDLSVLRWGLPTLLYLSIMKQTFHGFWRKILRKSYSSCFLTPCQVLKAPTTAPWTQGDKQASPDGAHSLTPGIKSQESLSEGVAICVAIHITLQTLNTLDRCSRDWSMKKDKRTKGIHLTPLRRIPKSCKRTGSN